MAENNSFFFKPDAPASITSFSNRLRGFFFQPYRDFWEHIRKLFSGNNVQSKFTPFVSPTPSPSPKPLTRSEQIATVLKRGFEARGNPPLAKYIVPLAKLGVQIEKKGGNPYLPAALALKESGGGLTGPGVKVNNYFGIMPGGQIAPYPDVPTSILGGGKNKQLGLKGVLFSGSYDPYFKSGKVEDFLRIYTPPSVHNNPDLEKQVALFNQLLDLFKEE